MGGKEDERYVGEGEVEQPLPKACVFVRFDVWVCLLNELWKCCTMLWDANKYRVAKTHRIP